MKFAYVQVRNIEEAQDIVQEAFAKVWSSTRTPRAEADFKRWLYRAISNLAIDNYRQEQRLARLVVSAAPVISPADEFERMLNGELILSALRRLAIRDRQLLYLRYFEDQPLAECARLLGLNSVSVRVLVRRALDRLRREMTAVGPLEEVAPNVP